jgi:hypothetical protein
MRFSKLIKAFFQNARCDRRVHDLFHPKYPEAWAHFNICDGRFFPPMILDRE